MHCKKQPILVGMERIYSCIKILRSYMQTGKEAAMYIWIISILWFPFTWDLKPCCCVWDNTHQHPMWWGSGMLSTSA